MAQTMWEQKVFELGVCVFESHRLCLEIEKCLSRRTLARPIPSVDVILTNGKVQKVFVGSLCRSSLVNKLFRHIVWKINLLCKNQTSATWVVRMVNNE